MSKQEYFQRHVLVAEISSEAEAAQAVSSGTGCCGGWIVVGERREERGGGERGSFCPLLGASCVGPGMEASPPPGPRSAHLWPRQLCRTLRLFFLPDAAPRCLGGAGPPSPSQHPDSVCQQALFVCLFVFREI